MFNSLDYIRKSCYRNLLENYLKGFLPKLEGNILDIGSKDRRYDFLMKKKPIAIDIVEHKEKEIIYGDVNKLNFEDEHFDSAICLEVLEHLTTPHKAVSEIYRILKKNGTLFLSVPFMVKAHGDYLRFTKNYLKENIFTLFSEVKIYPIGNFYTIILDILRDKIIKIRFTPLRYFSYLPYLLLVLFIPFSKLSKEDGYISGYFIVANK